MGCDKASGPATVSPCASLVGRATVGAAAFAAAPAAKLKATTRAFKANLLVIAKLSIRRKEHTAAPHGTSHDD
jgi:hypothetical protein